MIFLFLLLDLPFQIWWLVFVLDLLFSHLDNLFSLHHDSLLKVLNLKGHLSHLILWSSNIFHNFFIVLPHHFFLFDWMFHSEFDIHDPRILLLALPSKIIVLKFSLTEISFLPGQCVHEFLNLGHERMGIGAGRSLLKGQLLGVEWLWCFSGKFLEVLVDSRHFFDNNIEWKIQLMLSMEYLMILFSFMSV